MCGGVEPKGSTLGGINIVFAYEVPMRREFDDLTGMKDIGVHRITVGCEQMSVRREPQCQRAPQLRSIEYQSATG